MSRGRLVLLRHGQPEGHDGRCIGQSDTQLAMHGVRGATALAERWAESGARAPGRVIASDLQRAADTARLIASQWGLHVEIDPRLREMSFGDWDGISWTSIMEHDGERSRRWADDWVGVAPPGGESGQAFAERVATALSDLRALAAEADADVLVVTHAGWIRVATTLLLGEPLGAAFDRDIDCAHGAVFALSDASTRLVAWNVADPFDATPSSTTADDARRRSSPSNAP